MSSCYVSEQHRFWWYCMDGVVHILEACSLTLVLLNKFLDATATSNFQPIRLLDPDCCYKFAYLMANSADPEQKPADLDLHCLHNMIYPDSAGQGLIIYRPRLSAFNSTKSWYFYAPNFGGVYCFWDVCACMHPSVRPLHFLMHSITSEPCMLGFWNFIYGFFMKK